VMGYFGKILGGMAGFAMGGPFGAVVGAALGHAADSGAIPHVKLPFGTEAGFGAARVASMFGKRDHVFTIAVVVLSAKLAKCDGPVNRMEIDAFKRQFRVPSESVRDVGRLFDQARDSSERHEPYAIRLAQAFADERTRLEQVLGALFVIARADGPVNTHEMAFLSGVHRHFGLDQEAWEQARGPSPRQPPAMRDDADPYVMLGVPRTAKAEELRAAWKRLMRENHPDSLAARGVPAAMIARASNKVAEINAAWDRIKRDRGL
jgi:DnaJ like chaperone protein